MDIFYKYIKKFYKKELMNKYLIFFLVGIGVIFLGFLGFKYKDKMSDLKNLFNLSGVDVAKLEKDNLKLKEDIKQICLERDLLKPEIKKYELRADSLSKLDSLNRVELFKIKEQNKILERRLRSSKDSVNKYKSVWTENLKKYNKFKRSQRKPSNSQTLEFFKNY